MNKIKKGDQVIVIAGKDKGKKGVVLQVFPEGKLLVEGINLSKKNLKANPNTQQSGGILMKVMPIDRSNVMLFNNINNKRSRVGIRVLKDGSKVRYFKSTDDVVDV